MTAFNPKQLFDKTIEAGNDWADKRQAAELLEETKKTVLADLMLKAESKSMAEAKVKAEASPVYQEFIANMNNAKREENRAKVKYDAIKKYCDHVQTLSANQRAEMKLGGIAT